MFSFMFHCLLVASAVFLGNASATEQHGSSDTKCPLTVKVLDAMKGKPAGPMAIKVYRKSADGVWIQAAAGMTDVNGEIHDMITEQEFPAGLYRVEFDTKTYWLNEGVRSFHEKADVVFEAHVDGHQHYILALLLSPFSFTTTAVISNPH